MQNDSYVIGYYTLKHDGFRKAFEYAQLSSKRALGHSMQPDTEHPLKYEHKVYSQGSFYYEGLMYNTKDGSPRLEINSVDAEMMRIGKMVKEY